jgi:sec-independent protein translocase protein TatA
MAIGMPEILLIFVVILILFGPKRLPELARSIGKSVREYRKNIGSDKELKG